MVLYDNTERPRRNTTMEGGWVGGWRVDKSKRGTRNLKIKQNRGKKLQNVTLPNFVPFLFLLSPPHVHGAMQNTHESAKILYRTVANLK